MKIILFATLREALPTLTLFKAKKITETVHDYDEGKILISGMGILAVMAALAPHLSSTTEIINAGLVGALDDSLEIGTIAFVGTVTLHYKSLKILDAHSLLLASLCYPEIQLGTGPSLVTSLVPIHDPLLKREMRQKSLLVDMEGYAAAYMARQAQIPCTIVKTISDYSRPEPISLMQQNIDNLAEGLANALITRQAAIKTTF